MLVFFIETKQLIIYNIQTEISELMSELLALQQAKGKGAADVVYIPSQYS